MHLTLVSLLAFVGKRAYGYLDTSPFFMLSTSELLLPTNQLQSGAELASGLISTLSQCPSDFYLLISQPGVSVSDFSISSAAPTLSESLNHATHSALRSSVTIPEVAGEIDIQSLAQKLGSACDASSTAIDTSTIAPAGLLNSSPQVLSLEFPTPSKSQPERAADILDHDRSMSLILNLLSNRNYTVIYTTTPEVLASDPTESTTQYEMSNHDQPLRTELKRDLHPDALKTVQNQTLVDGPLFERYQFFTPGLFMGLLVSFLLLSILYVAIYGVASLQVSYAAFDKENGPAAQKKAH